MNGYVAKKGDRWYAVVYEGLDPVAGRERRRWHAAGTERADASRTPIPAFVATEAGAATRVGRCGSEGGLDTMSPSKISRGCGLSYVRR